MTASERLMRYSRCLIEDCEEDWECENCCGTKIQIVDACKQGAELLEKKEQGKIFEILSWESEQAAKGLINGQIKWERDIAIEQLKEIGKCLGQKMNDVKALIKAKEENRLIELPVPLGEPLYCIDTYATEPYIFKSELSPCDSIYQAERLCHDWGKIFFDNEEEAEKRLAELRGEE